MSNIGDFRSVTKTASITRIERSEQKGSERDILLFTVTGDGLGSKGKKIEADCKSRELGFEHVELRGKEFTSRIVELREQGVIGDGTQIIIYIHGRKNSSGDHFIDSANSCEVVEAIRKPLQNGKGVCSATVYLASCSAGDAKFGEKLQELHNRYKAGACVLLSSGKPVLSNSTDESIREICAEVGAGQRDGRKVTPAHVFARIAASSGDCVTLVEANRSRPLVAHGPKFDRELGRDGLMHELDKRAVVYCDHGRTFGGLSRAELEPSEYIEGTSDARRIVGEAPMLRDLRQAVTRADYKEDITAQKERITDRFASRGSASELQERLEENEDWMASIRSDKWSDAHKRAFELFCVAALDVDAQRRAEKQDYLFGLFGHARSSLECNESEMTALMRAAIKKPSAFHFLTQKEFLIKSDAERSPLSEVGRIRPLCSELVISRASWQMIAGFLEGRAVWRSQFGGQSLNESHTLVAHMLWQALPPADGGGRDGRAEIRSYLTGLLRERRQLLDKADNRSEWLSEVCRKYGTRLSEFLIGEGLLSREAVTANAPKAPGVRPSPTAQAAWNPETEARCIELATTGPKPLLEFLGGWTGWKNELGAGG